MQDQTNSLLRQTINADFEKHIPNIYIKQIEKTKNTDSVHFQQLKGLHCFYRLISANLPNNYLTKSGIRMDPREDMFCKNPYETGIIENMSILLEKQFFDCVALLYSGSYRPIMTILRYMLELAAVASTSIIDKKQLTGEDGDLRKGMSHIQFASFLISNFEARQKEPSARNIEEKRIVRCMQTLMEVPEQHAQHLKFKKSSGDEAIKKLYSGLSIYAHANIFQPLRWDGGFNDTCINETGLFVGMVTSEGYHRSLRAILVAHEFIFYLLLVAAYENIGCYQLKLAKKFLDGFSDELSYLKSHISFPSIENLIKHPPKINFLNTQKYIELDNRDEYDETDECPNCGDPMYVPNEECVSCHIIKFRGTETWHSIF